MKITKADYMLLGLVLVFLIWSAYFYYEIPAQIQDEKQLKDIVLIYIITMMSFMVICTFIGTRQMYSIRSRKNATRM